MKKKIFSRINHFHLDLKYFGFYIAITNFLLPLFPYLPSFASNAIMRYKHKKVIVYLEKKYSKTIQNSIKNIDTVYEKNLPIWFCWLQGENDLPAVVKKCLASIKKNAGTHPVIIISLENYKNYIEIPKFIVDKFEKKEIGPAHFSDILRTVLLSDVGGCWIDATVLLTSKIDEAIFQKSFYSVKFEENDFYITKNMWSNFFLVSQKNSALFCFVKEMFYDYLKEEKKFIDYFMMDYFIYIGYCHSNYIKKLIDCVPHNNIHVHSLAQMLNNKYDNNLYQNLIKQTYIHKLSWKSVNKEKTKQNNITYWGYILEN